MKIKISADSTCDLPRELIEEYDIGITPLYIVMDGVTYRDGENITAPELFEMVKKAGKIGGTSAVNVQDYIDHWTAWKQDCDAIVHVGFDSELSASLNNARIAAAEVGDVYVVDALNLSTGYGHLVLDAAEMARAGMEPAAITAELEKRVPKVDASFVLDTLDYLAKGGRCSALTALGANLLGLKPCIEVHDGVMGVAKKYRGKVEKAFLQYTRDRLKGRDDIDLRRVFITDSGVDEETRKAVEQAVLECQPFEKVYHSVAGCTISNHCGPKCLGILYYHK